MCKQSISLNKNDVWEIIDEETVTLEYIVDHNKKFYNEFHNLMK